MSAGRGLSGGRPDVLTGQSGQCVLQRRASGRPEEHGLPPTFNHDGLDLADGPEQVINLTLQGGEVALPLCGRADPRPRSLNQLAAHPACPSSCSDCAASQLVNCNSTQFWSASTGTPD